MKKLFLQSGKIMIGEFPEFPPGEIINLLEEQERKQRYERAIESAKASAVEVVNGEDCFHKINDWLTPLPGGGLGRQLQKGELCDLPKGWTVEYEDVPLKLYKQKVVEKIARLVPSENAQASIKYMHDRECRRQKDEGVLCQDHCYFKTSGLKECPVKSGIVATGISEAEQPEALTFAVTSTDIEESMEQSRDVRIRADSPRTYETGYLDGYVDGVMVTQDLEPVSPPPRAERGHTMNDIFDWLDSVGHYNSLVTSKDFKGIRLADIIYDFVTRKKP